MQEARLPRSAVAPLSALRVGYNNFGAGTATTVLDFSATNPTFTAFISGDLSIGRETGAGDLCRQRRQRQPDLGQQLDHHSWLHGRASDPQHRLEPELNSAGGATGSATGVFDALTKGAALDLHLSELNVGRGSLRGVGTGTLKWNQTEVIGAPDVYFGRGNATGILEVPAGGELHLGSAADPIANLRIAYNDAGAGTATANLDFSATNPTFTAFISGDLSIGRETGAADFAASAANGSLILGSNSTITLGSTAAPATLNIGWSQNLNSGGGATGSATGVFDARSGTVSAQLTELNVGRTAGIGTATGTFAMGVNTKVAATTVNIGMGPNATGTLNLTGGRLVAETINANGSNSTFNFTGGRARNRTGHTSDWHVQRQPDSARRDAGAGVFAHEHERNR